MATINTKPHWTEKTHEGAPASRINAEQELRRSVMACMLWEDSFYEDGQSIADRISAGVAKVAPDKVANIAIDAREQMKLRHVPLLIARSLAALHYPVASLLERIIQRPDELTEFLAIYWKNGRQPLSAQVKKGLARAFTKFNAYQLAKYNRDGAIKLRDVLFLSHAKPKDGEQALIWKKLIDGTLESPDTWEVSLSAGKDKKSTWERLLSENSIGALALLRNLRNMKDAGVAENLIFSALDRMKVDRVLPFRFIAAARYAPQWEDKLEAAMFKCLEGHEKLTGKTVLIVDVSGSMYGGRISSKSELDRARVACSLAALVRELSVNSAIYATAGNDSTRVHDTRLVPSRRGFALSDAIYSMCEPLGGGGIFLKQVMDYVYKLEHEADRTIVITDEQDCAIGKGDEPFKANAFGKTNYLINVSTNKNGVGYGKWHHIDGFSEAIIDYIIQSEKQ